MNNLKLKVITLRHLIHRSTAYVNYVLLVSLCCLTHAANAGHIGYYAYIDLKEQDGRLYEIGEVHNNTKRGNQIFESDSCSNLIKNGVFDHEEIVPKSKKVYEVSKIEHGKQVELTLTNDNEKFVSKGIWDSNTDKFMKIEFSTDGTSNKITDVTFEKEVSKLSDPLSAPLSEPLSGSVDLKNLIFDYDTASDFTCKEEGFVEIQDFKHCSIWIGSNEYEYHC